MEHQVFLSCFLSCWLAFVLQSAHVRLPEKGATTGSIIGAIIGVILLLAIIGTAIAMYKKHRKNQLSGEGPPKYKPPPPKKNNNSNNGQGSLSYAAANDNNRALPLPNTVDSSEQDHMLNAEPRDVYHEDDEDEEREHYYSAHPSGWDDPHDSEVLPPYVPANRDVQDHHRGLNVDRGDSFVSPAMFV